MAAYNDDGSVTMFSPETLDRLYGTPENYASRVDECLKKMVLDRWILPRGAGQISRQAHAFDWRKDRKSL